MCEVAEIMSGYYGGSLGEVIDDYERANRFPLNATSYIPVLGITIIYVRYEGMFDHYILHHSQDRKSQQSIAIMTKKDQSVQVSLPTQKRKKRRKMKTKTRGMGTEATTIRSRQQLERLSIVPTVGAQCAGVLSKYSGLK